MIIMNKLKMTLYLCVVNLIICVQALEAQTTVNPGDDLNSIINNSSGETITINPGIYNPILVEGKQFSANNPLILKAAGDGVIIERGSEQWMNPNPNGDSYDAAVFIECSYIALEGIEFVGGDRGVTVHRSDHMIFRDCDFTQTLEAGVKVENNSEYIDFIDCLFAHTGLGHVDRQKHPSFGEALYVGRGSYKNWGQWPDATKYVWVEGCEFKHTGRGEAINIKAEVFHCTVKNNYIHDVALNVYDFDQTNSGAISLDHSLGYQGTTYREGERRENWVEGNRIETIRSGIQPGEPYVDNNSASRRRIAGIYSAGTGNNIVGNTVTDVTNGTLPEEANGIRFNHWSSDITKNIIWDNEVTNAEDGNDFGNLPNNAGSLAINQDPGSNPNSAQSWYPGGNTNSNSLSWNPTPTSISNGDNTITLDYSIAQNGVVLVQLYNTNWNYIGQVYQNISAGTSQITLNLETENLSDDNYIIRAELRNSSWSVIDDTRITEQVPLSDTPPPSGNSLAWNPTPTSISNGDNQITLDYSIDQAGVVLVQLYSGWNYLGQAYQNVSAGAGQVTLNLEAENLSAGNYRLRAELRNSGWSTIDGTQISEEVPFGGTPPPNAGPLAWNPTPTSISNGDNQITLDYSIDQAGVVLVQLYSGWNYLGQAYQNVSAGAGQVTLNLEAENLSAGNYRLRAELRNSGWSTIDGTQINEEVPFNDNNKIINDLSQNIHLSPNPANQNIQLTYEISENTQAQMQIYDAFGKLVKNINNVELYEGLHNFNVDVSDLSAGMYFCTLQSDKWQAIEKFVIAR